MGAEAINVKLNHTTMFSSDSWRFAQARYDQGFFWYLLYVRHHSGTWVSPKSTLWVAHYWGPYKPWRDGGLRRMSTAAHYLKRLGANETNTSKCIGVLLELRMKGIAMNNKRTNDTRNGFSRFQTLGSKGYKNMGFHPILPCATPLTMRVNHSSRLRSTPRSST